MPQSVMYTSLESMKQGLRLLSAVVVAVILFTVPSFAGTFTAEFQDVDGKVFVIKNDSNDKLPAKIGMKVGSGDTIETWEDGFAEILYEDGNVTVIDEKTYLTIKELSVKGEKATSVLRLAVGRIKNSVTKVAGTRTKFEVRTKSAVAGVTGTPDWVVMVKRGTNGQKHKTEVDLLGKAGDQGSLSVKGVGKAAGAKPLTLTPGTRTVASLGLPPAKPFKISPQRANNLIKTLPVKTSPKKRSEKRKEMKKKVEKKKAEKKEDKSEEESKEDEESKDEEAKDEDSKDQATESGLENSGSSADAESNDEAAAPSDESGGAEQSTDEASAAPSDEPSSPDSSAGGDAGGVGSAAVGAAVGGTDSAPSVDVGGGSAGAGGGIQLNSGAMMDHLTQKISVGQIVKAEDDATGETTETTTTGGELPNQDVVVPTTTRTTITINIIQP